MGFKGLIVSVATGEVGSTVHFSGELEAKHVLVLCLNCLRRRSWTIRWPLGGDSDQSSLCLAAQ